MEFLFNATQMMHFHQHSLSYQLSITQQPSGTAVYGVCGKNKISNFMQFYLSSWRQGATAVRSAAAVHHPVATLEQALA